MFKSILRFVGLCLFLIFIGGNVWAGTLSSSDPCYGKYYTGPGGGSISCNYEDTFGKCFQVSNGVCEFWCKQPYYFRLVNSSSITSSSQITSNMEWICQGGTNLTGSCGTQKTSYDGQTYYKNESYLDCRKTLSIGSDAPALAGQSSAYVEFKVNPDFTSTGSSYGFDVKAGKTWNPYNLTDSYPSWVYSSRGYRCGAGTRINSSAQLCVNGSRVGRISGSSCSTSSSVISAQPYCSACADGTYNDSYTTSTSCTTVPENSTANSDKTGFLCNAGFYAYNNAMCLHCPYRDIAFTADVTSPVGATRVSECYYPGNSGGGTDDGTGTYTYGGNCSFDSSCTDCPMNLTFWGKSCSVDLPTYFEDAAGSYCTSVGNTGQGWGECKNSIMQGLGNACLMQNVAQGVYHFSCNADNYNLDSYGDSSMDFLRTIFSRFPSDLNCDDSGVSIWVD